jgi:hypothetical protein
MRAVPFKGLLPGKRELRSRSVAPDLPSVGFWVKATGRRYTAATAKAACLFIAAPVLLNRSVAANRRQTREANWEAQEARADDLLVVKTLAVRAGFRPAKLRDIGTSLATVSFQTSVLHHCSPAPPLRSRRIFRHGDEWQGRGVKIGRVTCFAAATFSHFTLR